MTTLFPHVIRDDRGTSMIELAIVAPMLAGLMLGMVDVSLLVQRRLELQEATAQLANIAAATAPNSLTLAGLRTAGAHLAHVPEDQVTLALGIRCNNGPIQPLGSGCDAGQQRSNMLTIRIQDQFGASAGGVGFLSAVHLNMAREVQIG
jgi:Flp pilus assembly pilin Flp